MKSLGGWFMLLGIGLDGVTALFMMLNQPILGTVAFFAGTFAWTWGVEN